jgi:hypothetical protein
MTRVRMIHRPPAAEHPLQRRIADALRLELAPPGKVSRDGVVWWSVDHASYARTAPGARVGRGVVAGAPDLFVLHRGIVHMVEVKTPAGELSDPQRSVMSAVLAGGGRVGVVRDAEEMLGLLDAWGIPRARRLVLRASAAARRAQWCCATEPTASVAR